MQAGYGQYVIDSSPSDAREALGAIQATSREALDEMRRMLGVLRQQDAARAPGSAAAAGRPKRARKRPGAQKAPGAPGAPRSARGARCAWDGARQARARAAGARARHWRP